MVENVSENFINDERKSSSFKLSYALSIGGHTGMAMIGVNLAKYYIDFVGMNPIIFGYAHLTFAIINTINDPFIGYAIDRSSEILSRWCFRGIKWTSRLGECINTTF